MGIKEQVDLPTFLGSIEPYGTLDPEIFLRLAASARVVRLERDQPLFEQGQPCDGIHVVVSGQIKLAFSSPHGAEKVVTIAAARQGIGEECLSPDRRYPFHAKALRDSTLIFLPKSILIDCLETDQNFAYRLMKHIAEKFHHLLLDVEASSLLSGTERVIDFLMHQVGVVDEDGSAVVELSLPKSIIASRLSLTQEHFSRLLRQLSESGMIAVEGRMIHVPNIDRLGRYFDSGAGHGTNRNGRSSGRGRSSWERLAAA